MMGFLYALTFASGKKYIGVTTSSIPRRLSGHRRAASRGNTAAVYSAWRKHGVPSIAILAVVENAQLYDTEMRAIKIFNTFGHDGYNSTPGGEASPMLVPATAKKVSLLASTPERIARNIEIHLGSKRSDECRLKMSQQRKGLNKGVPKSAEHRRKISEANKIAVRTYVATPEHCAKISKANLGRKFTEEHKQKIAAAHRGKPLSEAHKQKLRVSRVKKVAT